MWYSVMGRIRPHAYVQERWTFSVGNGRPKQFSM